MSAGQSRDRLQYLLSGRAQPNWNGIDYVEVMGDARTQLKVHFLNTVALTNTLVGKTPVTISGGATIPAPAVLPIDESAAWSSDADGRPVLSLAVAAPGDGSTYTLAIESTAVDPYFNAAAFTFYPEAVTEVDYEPRPSTVPPPAEAPPPIDYLAKDFGGFIQALSDFSSLRYPDWIERSEADVAVALMETLSAIADELSYYQDRVAAEATLATATQRVSLMRHARLVDYEPSPGLAATVMLQLDVAEGTTTISAGLRCSARGPDGLRVSFVVGESLSDPVTGALLSETYPVDARWNAGNLVPYWWDASEQVLPAGATVLWLEDHGHGLAEEGGQQLLIDTEGVAASDPPSRELVATTAVSETLDPVFGLELTRVELATPTGVEHDLSRTQLAGNVVPATHGTRVTETFTIPGEAPAPTSSVPLAVVRTSANWTAEDPRPDYRYTLAAEQLAWTQVSSGEIGQGGVAATPQIALASTDAVGAEQPWVWRHWLLGSGAESAVFTLTPERYSEVGAGPDGRWFEYDGEGVTLRFGDGVFGISPTPGTEFSVSYLAGGGVAGNVPADTIVEIESGQPQAGLVVAVTNPMAASGGAPAESPQQVRDRAPYAFQSASLSVARAEDYVAAAQSQPWVMQAGTAFRWTGSWLTVLTTADPRASEELTVPQMGGLGDLLDRRRPAGYESYVLAPRYAPVDLQIVVEAQPTAFATDVEASVLDALRPGVSADGSPGFFDHSRWSFGQPLDSSALLGAIQRAQGVLGVISVAFRRRGVQTDWITLPDLVAVPADQLLRVDDDPDHPENGSLRLTVEGGR